MDESAAFGGTWGEIVTPEKVDQETFRSLLLQIRDERRRSESQIRRLVAAFSTALFFLATAVAILWVMVTA